MKRLSIVTKRYLMIASFLLVIVAIPGGWFLFQELALPRPDRNPGIVTMTAFMLVYGGIQAISHFYLAYKREKTRLNNDDLNLLLEKARRKASVDADIEEYQNRPRNDPPKDS